MFRERLDFRKEKNMRVLVLNQDYTFLGICSPESAICAWYTNKAIIEESYEIVWHSVSMEINVPAVIRLKKYIKIIYERITYVSFTKRNVHLRDNYICQYCNIKFKSDKIGIDHVIPESKGGLSAWENTVTSCHPCNAEKGNRTPNEAGMRLIRVPKRPRNFREIIRIKVGEIHDLWKKYL